MALSNPVNDVSPVRTAAGDPNDILGVDDIASIFGRPKKWVYETFTAQCPPSKTGANGGGYSLWFRWQVLAFMEAKRIAARTAPPRRRKPRKQVA